MPDVSCGTTIAGRGDFLFTAGAVAIIAGLLFPQSARVLDVLLIFSLSLTAAVLIITFSARTALQVHGFALLVVSAAMLRMTLSVASAKLIFLQGQAGVVISRFGDAFVRNNCVLAVLIFGAMVPVSFVIICKAVRSIARNAALTRERDLDLKNMTAREAGFFVAMTGAARFMLCSAVVELFIIVVNLAASITVGMTAPEASGLSIKVYLTLAVGAAMCTQIPAVLTAVASAYLVRKSSVYRPEDSSGIVPVPSYDAKRDIAAKQRVITEDLEWFDESQCLGSDNGEDDLSLCIWEEIKDSDAYEAIAGLIESKADTQAKTILMAAESAQELGVTVPVNVAIRLAQKGKKTLLIDLDCRRNAVSKVFDIDTGGTQTQAAETCIDNLWVWPGRDTKDIKQVITSLESRYDCLVVYAPNIGASADWDKIAGSINAAMLFSKKTEFEASAITDFHKLLLSYGCEIFKPEEILAEAV